MLLLLLGVFNGNMHNMRNLLYQEIIEGSKGFPMLLYGNIKIKYISRRSVYSYCIWPVRKKYINFLHLEKSH